MNDFVETAGRGDLTDAVSDLPACNSIAAYSDQLANPRLIREADAYEPLTGRNSWRWSPASPGFRFWAGVLMALCAAYGVTCLVVASLRPSGAPLGDSLALWTWARFLIDHPAAEIYDPSILHQGQVAAGLDPSQNYPFAYPPSFCLPSGHWGCFLPAWRAGACWYSACRSIFGRLLASGGAHR